MNKDRELLLLSIFTFLTVSLWIFFELTKTTKTSTVDISVSKTLTPLDPRIDVSVLSILEERTK